MNQKKKFQEVINLFETGNVTQNPENSREYIIALFLQNKAQIVLKEKEKEKMNKKEEKERINLEQKKVNPFSIEQENVAKPNFNFQKPVEKYQQQKVEEKEDEEQEKPKKKGLFGHLFDLVITYYIFMFIYNLFAPKKEPKK